ncbi:hypothetical protein IF650_00030 [Cellulosimicrobium terreum]|nr:hypothetical protein [Cellulosimicrobium terreum]
MDDDRRPTGTWTPDGDAPLVRRLTERNVVVLLVGLAMIGAAVAIVRQAVVHPESVQVPALLAAILVALLVVLLGGLGLTVAVTFVRASRHVVRIGPDGVLLGSGALRLAWEDVATVRIRVVESRNPGRHPLPRRVRNHVLVHLAWRTVDGVDHRRLLAAPPFAAGTDLPLVHDLDAALAHFAGTRHRGAIMPA